MIDVDEDAEILLETGGFSSRNEVIEEAFKTLLKENPELRIEFAVEKYRSGTISLNRAAEIADKSSEEFKEILKNRDIKRNIGFLSKEDRRNLTQKI